MIKPDCLRRAKWGLSKSERGPFSAVGRRAAAWVSNILRVMGGDENVDGALGPGRGPWKTGVVFGAEAVATAKKCGNSPNVGLVEVR